MCRGLRLVIVVLWLPYGTGTGLSPSFLQVEQQTAENGTVGSPLSRQPVIVVRTGSEGVVATADLVGNVSSNF